MTDTLNYDEMLDGFEEAPSNRRLPLIQADETGSTYVFELLDFKMISGFGGDDFVIAEFKVKSAKGTKTNDVGTLCSDVIKTSGKFKKSALGNVRDLVGALANKEPSTVTRTDIITAATTNNLRGALINCTATLGETKDGGPWTRKTYTPVNN